MRQADDIRADMDLAEAAAWLARLQGEGRTEHAEAAFKAWLLEPGHAEAFARVTDTWEVVAGASAPSRTRSARRSLAAIAAGLAMVAVVVGGATTWVLRPDVYKTAVGQQQVMTLSDGSRVTLNTDSRVAVDYTQDERRVKLERGEALFEVAKNARRPFIVTVGDEEVRALGTSFVVRRDMDRTWVTLVEGRVSVAPRGKAQSSAARATILTPGERLTFVARAGPSIDRPRMETIVAWKRGEMSLDDVALAAAVAEINRYGGTPIEIHDARIGALRISGVFKTQDPMEFAQVVAQLHGLRVSNETSALVLER